MLRFRRLMNTPNFQEHATRVSYFILRFRRRLSVGTYVFAWNGIAVYVLQEALNTMTTVGAICARP